MAQQLLNTLYVQTQRAYLHLQRESVGMRVDGSTALRVPLQHLDGLVVFGNVSMSPFLIHRCAEDGRQIAWFSRSGRYRGRLVGVGSGNVLLRRAQHELLDDHARLIYIARQFVSGKIRNSRTILLRGAREATDQAVATQLRDSATTMGLMLKRVTRADTLDEVRGVEGNAAAAYFQVFEGLLRADSGLRFAKRLRRPPRDPVNSLLSFAYAILTNDCAAAAEGVGLDPQVGYLHSLRPGRPSLALDLVEELRPVIADRLVLSLINRMQITRQDFTVRSGGGVVMEEKGRKTFLEGYQKRKQEEIRHPVLGERMPFGLVPHVQARLLARFLRGDMDEYRPFVFR